MKYNPDIHHRRTIRLKGYDYSRSGAYFVTICTQNRECIFGVIRNGQMFVTEAGQMIQKVWDEMPGMYQGIDIDEFVIMPNHIHGIIILSTPVGAGPCACPSLERYCPPLPSSEEARAQTRQPQGVAPTLPDAVHRFKSFTTNQYRINVKELNWQPFPGRLWQRNYHEHIIRNEEDLNRIREYIINNPAQWEKDEDNPVNVALVR